jgi:hypothetical protein
VKKTLLLLPAIFLAACSLLQAPAETAAPPETALPSETATAVATAGPTQTQPSLGQVSGQVCYPSEFIPAMTAYFLETNSQAYTELPIAEDQGQYAVDLPPGNYLVFAWRQEYQLGGAYTNYVACGYGEACTDHNLLEVTVISGQAVSGIDICDWVIVDLPIPDGPSGGEPPEGLAGLVYRTPDILDFSKDNVQPVAWVQP